MAASGAESAEDAAEVPDAELDAAKVHRNPMMHPQPEKSMGRGMWGGSTVGVSEVLLCAEPAPVEEQAGESQGDARPEAGKSRLQADSGRVASMGVVELQQPAPGDQDALAGGADVHQRLKEYSRLELKVCVSLNIMSDCFFSSGQWGSS